MADTRGTVSYARNVEQRGIQATLLNIAMSPLSPGISISGAIAASFTRLQGFPACDLFRYYNDATPRAPHRWLLNACSSAFSFLVFPFKNRLARIATCRPWLCGFGFCFPTISREQNV